MKKIDHLVKLIDEELDGAKTYAEMYLTFKAEGKGNWANVFKDQANDELRHSTNIHNLALEEINKLRTVYTPPVEMEEMWEKSHKEYLEKAAWIKQMLAM